LLGCVLTQQLPFQTLLACYYVVVDAVLVLQFFFYKILFPPRPQILIPTIGSNVHPHRVLSPQSTSAPVAIHRVALNRDFQHSVVSIAILLGFISFVAADAVDDIPDDYDTSEWVGHVFAWICCSFYLTSRLPQILENHRRKSTQGINIALFTAALCGNLFYTIGILTNPLARDESVRSEYLSNALPYLLGSSG
jgi:solute carrier family 66 (lysosomal lysine-arginine transporter), member 1